MAGHGARSLRRVPASRCRAVAAPNGAEVTAQPQDPTSIPLPRPWRWIPTLYFSQGLPYVAVMTLAVVMYKNLGVGNTEIALYTSWLYLPWVVKPLWSPLVDLFGRKRRWIVAMQVAVAVSLAMVALTLPAPRFLQLTLAMFWLMAFASATHDIAADGFYMLALPDKARQAAFVGVRSLFYRLAMLFGQGALVWLAGSLQQRHGSFVGAWMAVMGVLAIFFAAMAAWHAWVLPRPAADAPARRRVAQRRDGAHEVGTAAAGDAGDVRQVLADFIEVFVAFFRRRDIVRVLAFLLLYRFAEAQLVKLIVPFLLDPPAQGGLGLTTQQVGIAYGTFGVAALTSGGLLGGWWISRIGLARALWPLVLAMHVPNVLYVALAMWPPTAAAAVAAAPGAALGAAAEGANALSALALVTAALAVEQFGYGFGFTAYMVFMLRVAARSPEHGSARDNPNQTAHYALCTGFMALGMMLPGMWAGWLQQAIGYTGFFIWCCVATLPAFAAAAWVRVDDEGSREVDSGLVGGGRAGG
ncbi:MAG: MFS transporter [Burkholderiales bacterium]|nr:MFS transporter [Burkholderiales bacterium]